MAFPDKSPVVNILKEFGQPTHNTRPENIVVDEIPQGSGAEEDLTRSNSWDILKPTPTPSAWRTVKKPWQETVKLDTYKEREVMDIQFDRREKELERQERELDRRGREIDRRERELDRRQREFDRDRVRSTTETGTTPQWTTAIEALKNKIDGIVIKERMISEKRELELESRVMRKVNAALEREHQIMQMSDNEVNEMIEDTVGYLLQKDEDIADRVRFQSLVYLGQEKLAKEAGLQLGTTSERLSTAWIMAIGPSVATEDRYNKAMEILQQRYETFSDATIRLINCKPAMEFLVEYTSHLRKEGSEQSFAPGRIPREAYMESIERQVKQSGVNGAALAIVVDFVCQDLEISAKPSEPVKAFESINPPESTNPPEYTYPFGATNPFESTKPAESIKPPESIKPSESTKLVEPESTKPSASTKPSESTKLVEPESTKPAESTQPSESPKPSDSTKPTESTDLFESAKSPKFTEPFEFVNFSESTKPSDAPQEVGLDLL